MKGIAKAKARGVHKGRKASINVEEVRRLLAEGVRPSAVARQLGTSRTHVWRVDPTCLCRCSNRSGARDLIDSRDRSERAGPGRVTR